MKSDQLDTKLAIVIPAYKGIFFKETLESIANQSDQRFTVYIGDDGSPENLIEIIEPFKARISIFYKRFDVNMGNQCLVGHWQRCIDLVRREEWIWLFSDDDVLECNCVESFYRQIEVTSSCSLYHFDVVRINHESKVLFHENLYDIHLSGRDFINKLVNFKIRSYAVEYVFNYKRFQEIGGFENFDMAWGTDHATWLKFTFNDAMITIPGAKVCWRSSGRNITSINSDRLLSERKRNAELQFFRWLCDYFQSRLAPLPFSNFSSIRWFLQGVLIYLDSFGCGPVKRWIREFVNISRGRINQSECYFYLLLFRLNYVYKKGTAIFRIKQSIENS